MSTAGEKVSYGKLIKNGIFGENPIFRLAISLCPSVAVTNTIEGGLLMGVAVLFVQTLSNVSISLLRNVIHPRIRLPAYIFVIAMWVTVINLLLEAYAYPVYHKIGLYLQLIVAFAIILARAELFASKNKFLPSMMDGIGMGTGFLFALLAVSFFRELLGSGSLYGFQIVHTKPVLLFVLPAGGFFVMGLLMGFFNWIDMKFYGGQGASGAAH